MFINFLCSVFENNLDKEAIVWKDRVFDYRWIAERLRYWQTRLREESIEPGAVIILEADFSPNSMALFLALIENACILVPLTSSVEAQKPEFIEIAQGQLSIAIDTEDQVTVSPLPYSGNHEYYDHLRQANHPGLILFSSGSTGKSKASVNDLADLLEKFKVPKRSLRTITFLLFDHIGGINTMLYTLSNAGCVVTLQERTPETVLSAVEKYQVELLPTSPTFINMIFLSEAHKRHDLISLKTVTYGTEPMPLSTLKRFHELFPDIRMQQTYGLSEVGILRSKSKSSDSLWVKVGGEGFDTRVVDGILHIKAKSAMLGYLNAPSPFTEDGWFNTGDSVEVDGEYLKILGRKSEIINVGGEKVYPTEVESVVHALDNVREATVYPVKNALTGNAVAVKVRLVQEEDPKQFALRLKKYCRKKMPPFKAPVKVDIVSEKQHSQRFKKKRV
ncbi:MAG: AMP-binding protein [Nitrospinota bacterium]|nr:AMP-binding protein [Nitrospinota bacterium]